MHPSVVYINTLYRRLLLAILVDLATSCDTSFHLSAFQSWNNISSENARAAISGAESVVCWLIKSPPSLTDVFYLEIDVKFTDDTRTITENCNSNYDYVEIKEGELETSQTKAMYCGMSSERIVIRNSVALVIFHSVFGSVLNLPYAGFLIKYRYTTEAVLNSPMVTPSSSKEDDFLLDQTGCDKSLVIAVDGSAYYIQSPNYPRGYTGGVEICWLLEANNQRVESPLVVVKSSHTDLYLLKPDDNSEAGTALDSVYCDDSNQDIIEAYDGRSKNTDQLLLRWCGGIQGHVIKSSGSHLLIRFYAPSENTDRQGKMGFELIAYAISDDTQPDVHNALYISGTRITIAIAIFTMMLISGGIFRRRQLYLGRRRLSRHRSRVCSGASSSGDSGQQSSRRCQVGSQVNRTAVNDLDGQAYTISGDAVYGTANPMGTFPAPPPYPGRIDHDSPPPKYEDVADRKDMNQDDVQAGVFMPALPGANTDYTTEYPLDLRAPPPVYSPSADPSRN